MHTSTKLNEKPKQSYLTPSRLRLTDKPIKIIKPKPIEIIKPKPIEPNSIMISSIAHPKRNSSSRRTDTKEKKSKSKDKNILFSSSSTRLPPKSTQSQTNLNSKPSKKQLRASREDDSLNLDLSKSYSKPPIIKPDAQHTLFKLQTKSITQNLTMSNYRNDNYNQNHINVYNKRVTMRDNNKRNDNSTFLNYDLGNTNNYTQIDEILLDPDKNQPADIDILLRSTKEAFNGPQRLTEMEIDLSKASVCFDSFLQCSTIKDIIKIRHEKLNDPLKNIFSNNSVYHLDTNEYIEGEKRNEIYSITPKENMSSFKSQYCLTDSNVLTSKEIPKKDCNVRITLTKPQHKTSDICSKTFFRRVPIVNYLEDKTDRVTTTCFRDSIRKCK